MTKMSIRRLHSQGLNTIKPFVPLYTRMLLKEYSRLFNKWRILVNRYYDQPLTLGTETRALMQDHAAKLVNIYRTNNERVMRAVHKFQMNFLGIKSSDQLYKETSNLISTMAYDQARISSGETAQRTTYILDTANNIAAEDDSPKDAIAYANERFKGGQGERRAKNIAEDQAHRAGTSIIQAIGDKFQALGVTAYKMWMSRRDSKVRKAHREADGQTVLANETFTVAGESLRYPGDPNGSASNVIGCRCFEVIKRKPGKKVKGAA